MAAACPGCPCLPGCDDVRGSALDWSTREPAGAGSSVLGPGVGYPGSFRRIWRGTDPLVLFLFKTKFIRKSSRSRWKGERGGAGAGETQALDPGAGERPEAARARPSLSLRWPPPRCVRQKEQPRQTVGPSASPLHQPLGPHFLFDWIELLG